ncbi:MAG: MobP3 family relaxase [Oscillospiraceae bacterium]
MSGVVFKQWYKPRNVKASTPVLNVKHLIYIATKAKECTFNNDCGFSLWGKLDNKFACDIDNFEMAKRIVKDVSEKHTVYRGVFSLDGETTENKGYYNRKKWQELTGRRMYVVAKELDIKPENFQWVASYHHKKGHPHCHVMFCDKSDEIRKEHISKERFEIYSEKVRGEFNRDVFAEELQKLRSERNTLAKGMKADIDTILLDYLKLNDEKLTEIRSELFSILPDLAPASTVNISSANDIDLQKLAHQLMNIAVILPPKGSLNYKYLSPAVKKEIDILTDMLMSNPQLSKPFEKYMNFGKDISQTFGNSKNSLEFAQKKYKSEFYTDIGNKILNIVKEQDVKKYVSAGTEKQELHELICNVITDEVKSNTNTAEQYQELITIVPTNFSEQAINETANFKEKLNSFTKIITQQDVLKHYLDMNFAIKSSEAQAEWQAKQQYEIQLGARLVICICDMLKAPPDPKSGKDKLFSKDKSKEAKRDLEETPEL